MTDTDFDITFALPEEVLPPPPPGHVDSDECAYGYCAEDEDGQERWMECDCGERP